MKEELLFCPLGGSGEIGMNMNLFAFGKPENQTLYTRSQTIYYYHIKNSSHCSSDKENKNDDKTMMLQIRFDALNRSKEVFVFNYNV